MLNSSNKSLIFNFDSITEKDNYKDWPYRLIDLIYSIQLKETTILLIKFIYLLKI